MADAHPHDSVTIEYELGREETLPIVPWLVGQNKQDKPLRGIRLLSWLILAGGVAIIVASVATHITAKHLAFGIVLTAWGTCLIFQIRWTVARAPINMRNKHYPTPDRAP